MTSAASDTSTPTAPAVQAGLAEVSLKLDEVLRILRPEQDEHRSVDDAADVVRIRRDLELSLQASTERVQALLVRVDQTATRATSIEVIRKMMTRHLQEAGVRRVDTFENAEWFLTVDGAADPLEVVEPAYVDSRTGRVIQTGRAQTNTGA